MGEPRFVHPELFLRQPNWRGPRVDNPAVSMNPLYALDTDRDDVMDHYRQMLRTRRLYSLIAIGILLVFLAGALWFADASNAGKFVERLPFFFDFFIHCTPYTFG
jgi:phosphonate transport system permease protein